MSARDRSGASSTGGSSAPSSPACVHVLLEDLNDIDAVSALQSHVLFAKIPSSRMPRNHVHGNGLPATFVPGRRNVCEGYWAANESFTRFSFPLFLKRKTYFTNPSCLPHWERKVRLRSTALINRISLEPFLRTRQYPALVLCSATAVEANFAVRPKARQYTRQVLKRTESLVVQKLHLRKRWVVLVLVKTR